MSSVSGSHKGFCQMTHLLSSVTTVRATDSESDTESSIKGQFLFKMI